MLRLIPSLRLFQNGQWSLDSGLRRTVPEEVCEEFREEPLFHFSQLLIRILNQALVRMVLFFSGTVTLYLPALGGMLGILKNVPERKESHHHPRCYQQ